MSEKKEERLMLHKDIIKLLYKDPLRYLDIVILLLEDLEVPPELIRPLISAFRNAKITIEARVDRIVEDLEKKLAK